MRGKKQKKLHSFAVVKWHFINSKIECNNMKNDANRECSRKYG